MKIIKVLQALGALLLGVACGAAVAVAHVGGVNAPDPEDRIRLAALPVAPVEETFDYDGREITPDAAARAGLACVEHELRTTCFRDEATLEAQDGQVPRAVWERDGETFASHQRGAQGRKPGSWRKTAAYKYRTGRRGHAHAANHDNSYPQSLWQHTYAAGWRIDRYSSCVWHNLQDFYNDNTSSFKTGNHSGVFSWDTSGGGSNWEESAYQYLQTLGNWSDEISSSLRRGC